MLPVRGEFRERHLAREAYFSPAYFELPQLFSLAHQIHDIYRLQPTNILEIGIGSGFTSSFFKRAGFDVTTADINEDLGPDVCAPISELKEALTGRTFDLVVCCEVLEHMPFSELPGSIETFRALGRRLYITLPNYKNIVGLGGAFNWVFGNPFALDVRIELPGAKKLNKGHYWEVGCSRETAKRKIAEVIRQYYKDVVISRYRMNPCHIAYYAHQ